MKLTYRFEGIRLENGLYPRADVVVTAREGAWGYDSAFPSITVTLPIAHLEASTETVRVQVLELARRLLNESVLEDWAKAQNLPAEPPLPRDLPGP